MCDKLKTTFQNFLKHGWIVPLIINILTCIFYQIIKIISTMIGKIPTKVWAEIFPYLHLKNKDLSALKRFYIYINIVLQTWIIFAIGFYMLFPYSAKNKYEYTNIVFYTQEVNDKKKSDYFDKIHLKIIHNSLYSKKTNIDIDIINNQFLYKLLNPIEWLPYRQSFAVTHNKTVFVCNADIADNKAYASNDAEENLDAILVHEAVHVMQNSRYGWFYSSFKMPYWVKEGYPIYSARNLSVYKEKEIIEYMTKTNDVQIEAWSIFEQDQFYGLMVRHAIEKMHKSVDDLHLGKVDYNEVLNSLLDEYNISKT